MRRLIKIAGFCFTALAVSLFGFYWSYEHYSNTLIREQQMAPEQANAIKHTTAAAEIYTILLPITGDRRAESSVIFLGKASEYLEQTVRTKNLDSAAEMLKDMQNNQVGITTAQWQKQVATDDLRATILRLARAGGLTSSSAEAKLPATLAELTGYTAIRETAHYLETQRTTIIARTRQLLAQPAP